MLKIRHNQIRKSIPVRQKTLKTFKDLSLILFSLVININLEFQYQVGNIQFEVLSLKYQVGIFYLNIRAILPDIGDSSQKSVI